MNTETQVAPDAATQNTASETAQETPEVATPETQAEPEQELTPEEKYARTVERMERRLNRKHAQAAKAEERAALLEQRLAELEGKGQQQEEAPKLDEKAIQERALQIAKVAQIADKSNSVYNKGKAAFPDFDEAIKTVISEAGALIDKSGLPTTLGDAILDAEKPEALIDYLGKNPDVAAELADLSPTQLARRLVRIEDQMSAKPKPSAAPKPLKPVKPSSSNDMPSDEDDVDTWMKKERARLSRG